MVGHGHPVALRGPRFLVDGLRPAILQRTDSDFINAMLAELRSESGREALRASIADERLADGTLRLFQPVQRTFHLVVVEAVCLTLGMPRLDPRRIDSAGLVVRRRGDSGLEAWMRAEGGGGGWLTLNTEAAWCAEPEAARRVAAKAPHPLLLPVPGAAPEPLSEHVTRLFPAPPDVCRAAGTTLLYGLVPVSSSETSEAPARVEFEAHEIDELPPAYLRHYREGARPAVPYPGELVEAAHARVQGSTMASFVEFLTHLKVVFDAFDGTAEAHARMRAALDEEITLEFSDGVPRATSAWLADAAVLLVDGEAEVTRRSASAAAITRYVEMPLRWPALSAAQARRFRDLSLALTQHRLKEIVPRRGRYDVKDARYELRAFVRVKRDDGCPPTLHWSEPSEPFAIAAWYDNGPVPPLQIQLPDLIPDQFRGLKPNVAFEVPSKLFNFLNSNSPKKILGGEARKGSGTSLGWICGFNIPIITLCAFILLYIILFLLNWVFFWLPWVRICIPFPAKKG